MPALEIMPMCGNMDEAQRRAHLPLPPRQNRRKSDDDDDDDDDNTVPVAQPPPQQQEHHHHHHHAPITSPTRIASKKIVRFLRRFRRRRSSSSSNSNKNGNGTETTTTTKSDATPTNTPTANTADGEVSITSSISHLLDHHGEEEDKPTSETEHMDEHENSTSSAIGFSAIGVKYWGKILEDEEEEPPEAYMGSMWNE